MLVLVVSTFCTVTPLLYVWYAEIILGNLWAKLPSCLLLIFNTWCFFFCCCLYSTLWLFPDKAQFHVWIKDYLLSLSHALSQFSPKEHRRTLSGHVNMNMAPAITLKRAEGWTSLTECSCFAGGKLVHKWVQWTGYREWRQEQELPSCLNCLWDQSCLFSAKQWAMNRRICATLSYFS